MTSDEPPQLPVLRPDIQSVDISQRSVFLFALIPGALAIGISRFFELSGGAYWIVSVAFPVVCMVTYWLVNVRGDFFDSTRAQVADNIYFLGFLFFLVSLSATLILFSSTENLEQRVVVEGFGIALVTTILGLFLRILLLQQSAPFEDSRERAERDLLAEILQSKANITAGNQALRQAQDVAISGLAETSRLLVEKTSAAGEEITRRVVTAASSIEEQLSRVDIPADLVTRALQPLLHDLGTAVGEVARSAQEQAKASREFSTKVKALAPSLEIAATALEALNRAVEAARPGVEAIGQSINATATSTAAVAKSTDITRASMEALAVSVTRVHDGVQALKLDTGLEQTVSQMRMVQEQLVILQRLATDIVPAVKDGLGPLPDLLSKFNSVAEEYRLAAATTQALVSELGRLQGPEALRTAAQEVAGVAASLRAVQDAMNAQIDRLRQAPSAPRPALAPNPPPPSQQPPQQPPPRLEPSLKPQDTDPTPVEPRKRGLFASWLNRK